MLKKYTSEIIKMYTVDKMSTVEIANIYNNKASNVWYILKKNNIPIRSNKVNSRKYNVNDNYFENIDLIKLLRSFVFISPFVYSVI